MRTLSRSSATERTFWKQPALSSSQGLLTLLFCLEQPPGHSSSGWLLFFIRTRLIHQLSHEYLFKPQSPDHAGYLSPKLLIAVGLHSTAFVTMLPLCIIYCHASLCQKLLQDNKHVFISRIPDLVVGLIYSRSSISMCWCLFLWPILSHSWVLNLNMTVTKRPSLTFQFTLVSLWYPYYIHYNCNYIVIRVITLKPFPLS